MVSCSRDRVGYVVIRYRPKYPYQADEKLVHMTEEAFNILLKGFTVALPDANKVAMNLVKEN